MRRVFRPIAPMSFVDLVIVAPVHEIHGLFSLVDNVKKYVKGSFALIMHYNGDDFLDENTLPSFAWIVRSELSTERGTKSIARAVNECLTFAVEHFQFLNVMTFSSGSMFYRDFDVPTYPKIALSAPEQLLNANVRLLHTSPIPISYIGRGAAYLAVNGSSGWQYERGFDMDTQVHDIFTSRGFQWTRGSQYSGQIFPYNVAEQIVEDCVRIKDDWWYCLEEMWFSTYAYNYAVVHGITIEQMETITDWAGSYGVTKDMILKYREAARVFRGIGHAVCKVIEPDVRDFINGADTG